MNAKETKEISLKNKVYAKIPHRIMRDIEDAAYLGETRIIYTGGDMGSHLEREKWIESLEREGYSCLVRFTRDGGSFCISWSHQ